MDLNSIASSVKQRFVKNESIKSMDQFIEDVKNNPAKFCRNSATYLRDVFDYYGFYTERDTSGEQIRRWRIFDDQKRSVWGQEKAQNQIYSALCSFAESRINKIILFHGPNGSAKTSMIAAMMQRMEDYSQTSEGAIYTFNWIFSDREEKNGGLGFNDKKIIEDKSTLAFTPPDDISFKLSCNLKDNPLFLIPKEERKAFLEKLLGQGKVPHHLIEGELCQKCQTIYNQLQIAYDGDWTKIVRHVQVERFYFSKRLRCGLVSIEPQQNTDAGSRALNLEKNYRIPALLALSDMYEPHGDLIDANRGVVELSEIFKRHPEANKYLLTTAEWGTVNLPNFIAYLDCVIFATGNEINLTVFKADIDWPSFNGRFIYIRVPYLLQVSKEQNLYKELMETISKTKHVAPHTEYIIALWAVMTRLRRSSKSKLAKNLSAVQKALLYDRQQAPESWKNDERMVLVSELPNISVEYDDARESFDGQKIKDAAYEGRRGASYREVASVINTAVHNKDFPCLSPPAILHSIDEISKDKSIYEFLRLSDHENYYDYEKIMMQLKRHYLRTVRKDIRNCTGLVADDEYVKLFDRYISHVRAWSQGEKILNQQTKNFEDPSEAVMDGVESLMEIPSKDKEAWRKVLLSKIATWALNHIGEEIPYQNIFSDIFEVLKNNTVQKYKEQIDRIQHGILRFGTEDWKLVTPEDQAIIVTTIDNMKKIGYSDSCLKEAVVYLIKNSEDKEPKLVFGTNPAAGFSVQV